MSFGVTLQGFIRKHLSDVVTDLQAAVKAAFGASKRVDAKSPIGILIGIVSQPVGELWEVAEALYNAFDPATAEGAQFDNCLDLVGLTRKSQIYSTCTTLLGGVVGTAIPAGSIVKTVDNNDEFETTVGITLGTAACRTAVFEVVGAVISGTYRVYVNGYSYSKVAVVPGDTAATIYTALALAINTGPDAANVTGTPLSSLYLAISSDTGALFSVAANTNMTVGGVGNMVEMQSVVAGAIAAYVGKLTSIVTPVSGWSNAYNYEDAVLGGTQETDAEGRQRRALSLAVPGSTTPDAITGKLLAVDGVTNVTVLQNVTDATDANGLLPHSIMAIVLGGSDADIAQVMWENTGGGIYLNGNTSATVVDSQGISQVVRWQRPTDKEMWVRATYVLDTEYSFPDGGATLMAQAALAVGYSHAPGKDVLPERFHGPVFAAATGIRTLLIEVALDVAGSPGAYQSTPYVIAATEIARFDITRITVTT